MSLDKNQIAQRIAQERRIYEQPECSELYQGARGAAVDGVSVHSLRMPGVVAQQQVFLSGTDERIVLQHEVLSREAYMPGVCLACEKVGDISGLQVGLEHVL